MVGISWAACFKEGNPGGGTCGDGDGRGSGGAAWAPLSGRWTLAFPQIRPRPPQPLRVVAMSRFFTTGSDSESESSLSGEELVTKPVGGNYGKQ